MSLSKRRVCSKEICGASGWANPDQNVAIRAAVADQMCLQATMEISDLYRLLNQAFDAAAKAYADYQTMEPGHQRELCLQSYAILKTTVHNCLRDIEQFGACSCPALLIL